MEPYDLKASTSLIIAAFLATACGHDNNSTQTQTSSSDQPPVGSSPSEDPMILSGRFLDSAVMGLAYSTATQHGITDIEGTFHYRDGESITFYLGDPQLAERHAWTLGSTTAREVLTPLELLGTDTVDQSVRNMLRLLQSLDLDRDPSNGIELSTDGTNLPDGNLTLDLSLSDSDFEVDPVVTGYIAHSISTGDLVPAQSAVDHFQLTLNELLDIPTGTWNYTHGTVDGVAVSGLTASIRFDDEAHYMAQYHRPGDSGAVSGDLSLNGMSFFSEIEEFHMTLDGMVIDQYPEEFLDQVPESINDFANVALGLDANLRVLPNTIVLESRDGQVVLNYARGDMPGDGTVAYLEINSPNILEGEVGDILQLDAVARTSSSAIILPMQFSWSTSDPAVATVNGSGLVTAVGDGTVTIMASASGYEVSIQIEVSIENFDSTESDENAANEDVQTTENELDQCPDDQVTTLNNEEHVSQHNANVDDVTPTEQTNQQTVLQSNSGEECVPLTID